MVSPRWPVSVKGIVPVDGGVVLLRNERDEWELPGGRLELGETPEECVAREIAEELGIDVRVGGLIDAWVYPVLPESSVLVLSFGCEAVGATGLADLVTSDEHHDVGVFPVDVLGTIPLPDGYRRSIERWHLR
jgi:8-oxo-dGTP pyrophosphatase MutT (NUDIX family)